MRGGVWLVVGVQGSGKTTIADGLANRFDRGVHIRGGQFYRWAIRGWVQHDDIDQVEAARHLQLRYKLSAMAADQYCAAGFVTVVQDNIYGDDVVGWLNMVASRPRHLVVLRPSTDVVAQRDAHRHARTGKVAYRPGAASIRDLDEKLATTPRLGLWLDNSRLSVDETIEEILRREFEARVHLAS